MPVRAWRASSALSQIVHRYQFHSRCFVAWELERTKAGIAVASHLDLEITSSSQLLVTVWAVSQAPAGGCRPRGFLLTTSDDPDQTEAKTVGVQSEVCDSIGGEVVSLAFHRDPFD